MICLDKSCFLGYNSVKIWVGNQWENLFGKYCWLGKNHIWYVYAPIRIVFKVICLDKSGCLGYNCVHILELVINKKIYSENIIGKVKFVFDTSLSMFTLLFLKWVVYITHSASIIIILMHELLMNKKVESENIVGLIKIIFDTSLT